MALRNTKGGTALYLVSTNQPLAAQNQERSLTMLKKIGRWALVPVVAVAVIVLAMALTPKVANADGRSYAKARADAMQKRESAFRSITLPDEVITQFLRVTETPGEKTLVLKGQEFESMVVHGAVYHGVVVSSKDAPMLAEKWEVHWGARVFSVFLVFPRGDTPYWSFKIRTDKTQALLACSPTLDERIHSTVARAT